MTGQLKTLILLRQKACSQNNTKLLKYYRNQVNRERKICNSTYYQVKVKILVEKIPGNGGLSVDVFVECREGWVVLR
jgi:hypothetical protein